MTARCEWLDIGGPIEPWARVGLVVTDGDVHLFGTGLHLVGGAAGLRGWALSGVDRELGDVDGLHTRVVQPAAPVLVEYPVGAIGLDHVVITTDALERTCDAITAATEAPLRRVRELGDMRQGFHRLGSLVVEVVERADLPTGRASFWGFVINVADLAVAVEQIGREFVTEPKPAVQPGRSIATVLDDAGLGLPVALMTL